jgi:hypothetical protein
VHRCLYLPRIHYTDMPELVVIKVPTDSPDTFFEIKLTPDEAFELVSDLMADIIRAKNYRSREDWRAQYLAGSNTSDENGA